MTGTKKIICAATVVALVASLSTMGVMAASYNEVAYSTASEQYCASVVNDTGSAQTLAINTRPTTGVHGAKVVIKTSNNIRVAVSPTFPYQVSVSDWETSIPSGVVRRIYVMPAADGETVKGTLYYKRK